MPRRTSAAKPGTERYRDERRKSGGPRIHGREWHDHDKPKPLSPASMAGADAAPEVESSGEHMGMNRRTRRKRMTPVGKGPKTKPGAAKKISRTGAKGRGRAGNPG